MPRLIYRTPSYRKHRASGQAVVTLDGQDHYPGPHGTAASKREYIRLVSQWRAMDRQLYGRTLATEFGPGRGQPTLQLRYCKCCPRRSAR
jgi:hypothetical protein